MTYMNPDPNRVCMRPPDSSRLPNPSNPCWNQSAIGQGTSTLFAYGQEQGRIPLQILNPKHVVQIKRLWLLLRHLLKLLLRQLWIPFAIPMIHLAPETVEQIVMTRRRPRCSRGCCHASIIARVVSHRCFAGSGVRSAWPYRCSFTVRMREAVVAKRVCRSRRDGRLVLGGECRSWIDRKGMLIPAQSLIQRSFTLEACATHGAPIPAFAGSTTKDAIGLNITLSSPSPMKSIVTFCAPSLPLPMTFEFA
jgi:hypothetical protein